MSVPIVADAKQTGNYWIGLDQAAIVDVGATTAVHQRETTAPR